MSETDRGYFHSFMRYTEYEGERVDRLAQMIQHGILAPNTAFSLDLPFKTSSENTPFVPGKLFFQRVIYVYPIDSGIPMNLSGRVSILLDHTLPTLDADGITEASHGMWSPMSFVRELYVLDKAEQLHFTGIVLPREQRADIVHVMDMVRGHIPEKAAEIKVRCQDD